MTAKVPTRNETITVYHGTVGNRPSLAAGTWVTTDRDTARYFAHEKAETIVGGLPTVVSFRLPEDDINWDHASMASGVDDFRGTLSKAVELNDQLEARVEHVPTNGRRNAVQMFFGGSGECEAIEAGSAIWTDYESAVAEALAKAEETGEPPCVIGFQVDERVATWRFTNGTSGYQLTGTLVQALRLEDLPTLHREAVQHPSGPAF